MYMDNHDHSDNDSWVQMIRWISHVHRMCLRGIQYRYVHFLCSYRHINTQIHPVHTHTTHTFAHNTHTHTYTLKLPFS